MITELTHEQKDKIPEYVSKWIEIGLSTTPIDHDKHNKALIEVYALAGLEAPKIIYFPCPMTAAIAAQKLIDGKGEKPSTNWLWGNQWAGYGAWGEFFKDECNVSVNQSCIDMMREGHYIWPLENVCIASERPIEIHMDNEGRSHNEVGASILYASGWGIYAWHGTVIPKQWIMEKPTAKEALTEPNLERRLAGCEIVGWDSILDQLNAKTIDKHIDPEMGELVEVDIPDLGITRFLRVRCGTGRNFALSCPSANTVVEAQAMIHSHTVETFTPPAFRS